MIFLLVAGSRAKGDEAETPPLPKSDGNLARLDIDATTLRGKVLCGYQGWFRCPGDSSVDGWKHWGRDPSKLSPGNLTFEMWPDMSEYGPAERYLAPGFKHVDGTPAHLFSSVNEKTVQRHFDWMADYGIDGVLLQRFVVNIGTESFDRVLSHVRASAKRTGRTFAICYDMTGVAPDTLVDQLSRDWKHLVDDAKVTQDERYLHHNGKPVVMVWGFYADRFSAERANEIIDIFKNDGKHGVTLIGGTDWQWRSETNEDWAKVYRRLDVISPWNVGNVSEEAGQKQATTVHWGEDLAAARAAGREFLPVIYPGFGWTNLKGPKAAGETIPRLKGAFFWRQFSAASALGIDMAYVAMFDEVDEATAIFKVSNTPPVQGQFQTFEGLPSDWYLRLAGEGTKLLRGERENTREVPIRP